MSDNNISFFYKKCDKALSGKYGSGEASAMTRLLFEDVFNWKKSQPDRAFSSEDKDRFQIYLQRLLSGEPVQHVTNIADFFGLQLYINKHALIPRPETEELVEWILDTNAEQGVNNKQQRILDIGTGSGCIPLAIKSNRQTWLVEGWDISKEALHVANSNKIKLNLEVDFSEVNILDKTTWPTGMWNVIVSNPPYIPFEEKKLMPEIVLDHEPHLALFVSDNDPLLFYRNILRFAKEHLHKKGWLFFECNENNAEEVHALGLQFGFIDTTLKQDMQGKNRMWCGRII